MIATSECVCGNAVNEEGARCETCQALQALDLEPGASRKEIESAYRVLVKVWHPDRFQSDPKLKEAAEEKLKAINSAHAYLLSVENRKQQRRRRPPASQRTKEHTRSEASGPDFVARRTRGRSRSLFDPSVVSRILIRGSILICGIALVAFLLLGMDSYLSSTPATGRIYVNYRAQIVSSMRAQMARVRERIEETAHQFSPTPAAPAATPTAQADATSAPETLPPPPKVPMPYVTTGLTKVEVVEVMGTPTASTGDSFAYGGSVFYFKNGAVAGWKVNRALIPLRVRLWPQGHVDAHLTTFTIGSSKNEVIAVQGTPNLLSPDKFAYGTSEVFFEGDRVIGWMNDHNSIQLKTAAR